MVYIPLSVLFCPQFSSIASFSAPSPQHLKWPSEALVESRNRIHCNQKGWSERAVVERRSNGYPSCGQFVRGTSPTQNRNPRHFGAETTIDPPNGWPAQQRTSERNGSLGHRAGAPFARVA